MPEEPKEDKGELIKATSSKLNPGLDETSLSQIEERIAQASSIAEIELWTRVREQIVLQDELVKDGKQRRLLERIQIISKTSFSFAAFTIGIILIFLGIPGFGSVLAGAGIYLIAPDYVREVLSKREREDKNDDKRERNDTTK